jgi:hypothetical protein
MAYETKDMTGSAFRNKRKEMQTHADLTGEAKIFGRDVWVNVWKKKDKNGDTYISIAFREKQPKTAQEAPRQDARISLDDDEMPF